MMTRIQRENQPSQMRVLIADDQAKVRSALRLVLEQRPSIHVVGEAINATGVIDWVRATCPDVILLDWELPGQRATDLVSELRCRCPDMAIVALSSRPEAAQAARKARTDAFVSKGDPPEQLFTVLEHLQRTRA